MPQRDHNEVALVHQRVRDGEVRGGQAEVAVKEDVYVYGAVVIDRAAVGAEGGLLRAAELALYILKDVQQGTGVELRILPCVGNVIAHHAVKEIRAVKTPGLGDYLVGKGRIWHSQSAGYQLDGPVHPIFLPDIVAAQSEI